MSQNTAIIIWAAEVEVDYEPGYLLGVFSTKEKAEKVAENYNRKNKSSFREASVSEYTLDEED